MKVTCYLREAYNSYTRKFEKPSFILGAGRKQTYTAHLYIDKYAWIYDEDYENKKGALTYTYTACGGYKSNKQAWDELQTLSKNFDIGRIEVEPMDAFSAKRYKNARKRFARYKQSGVSIKTAKTPVV